MPCYEAPPPYEGAQKENAEQAVSILCELVGGRVDRGEPLSPRLLSWYERHLRVDLEIATHNGETTKAHGIYDRILSVTRLLDLAFS